MGGLTLNCFPVEVSPSTVTLPFQEYPDWESSSVAKAEQPSGSSTWRYQPDSNREAVRLVFVRSDELPLDTQVESFDLGRFWRIATIFIEDALSTRLAHQGLSVESDHFGCTALKAESKVFDPMIELSTGISYEARRPFNDEPYRFVLSIQWAVRAIFKQSLAHERLQRIAMGMPVIFKPSGRVSQQELLPFKNRFIGRVRRVASRDVVEVACKDGVTRTLSQGDLWLEASPAVLKLYEQSKGSRRGPSALFRTIQHLNKTLTEDNRRNIAVLKDRMVAIRDLLRCCAAGSREQVILPFPGVDSGSITVSLVPLEVAIGGLW